MSVRYTPRAFSDREQIFDYLHARSPQAAGDIVGLIKQRIKQLGDGLYKGFLTNEPGIYTLWIAPYPYRVFYRMDANELVIIHTRHTSRRPWSHREF